MVAGCPTGESARRSGASFSRFSHILAVYEENGVFDVFLGHFYEDIYRTKVFPLGFGTIWRRY